MIQEGLGRRVFLTRAAGMVLTLGAAPIFGAQRTAPVADPYAAGLWLSGDHHIHTQYSIDGVYEIEEQVQSAIRGGLDFCVITDHGGKNHARVLLSRAYPELLAARRRHPEILIFQGLEWNIPAAEHGSVILPPTPDEAQRIAEFETRFDAEAQTAAHSELDAINGVRYLQEHVPQALFIANHPARRGLDSPHELRAWSDAGPDVMRGFEGAPGHGAAPLRGTARGSYGSAPSAASFSGYPLHSYRTWGGYDYYVAKVGGLWDCLLGEGRAFYITANSDAHRYYGDRREVNRATYHTLGYVTAKTPGEPSTSNRIYDEDYLPGAYARTYVHAAIKNPLAILNSMRAGNMWTAQGGVIEGLELFVHDGQKSAPMGATLLVPREADVELVLRVRPASRENASGQCPVLHHIDLIAGDIRSPAQDFAAKDRLFDETARVVAQFRPADGQRRGKSGWIEFRQRFARIKNSFFVRVRGTSSDLLGPRLDSLVSNPWSDLWFYSNPLMVRLPP